MSISKKNTDSSVWFAKPGESYDGGELNVFPEKSPALRQLLQDNSTLILQDLNRVLLNTNAFASFPDSGLQYPAGSWSKLVLKVWGVENPKILHQFSSLSRCLAEYPEITSMFISRLEGGSRIMAHSGETNTVIRIHLGLSIPDEDAELCGIRVGDNTYFWKEGESFAFLDALEHEAWNESSGDRYILIVDILRDEFKGSFSNICTRIVLNQVIFGLLHKIGLKSLVKPASTILKYLVTPFWPLFKLGQWIQSKYGLIRL